MDDEFDGDELNDFDFDNDPGLIEQEDGTKEIHRIYPAIGLSVSSLTSGNFIVGLMFQQKEDCFLVCNTSIYGAELLLADLQDAINEAKRLQQEQIAKDIEGLENGQSE